MQPQLTTRQLSQDVEPPFKRPRLDAPTILGRHREIGLMRKGASQDNATFLGSSSGIYFVRSVYNALQNGGISHIQGDNVPGEDDRLSSKKVAFWMPTELSDALSTSFEQLKDLSEEYFDHWHPTFPFLLAVDVLQAFERIASSPLHHVEQVIDDIDLAIVRAILSMTAADRRQCGNARTKQVPRALLFSSYTHAVESVQVHLSRPATMRSLQAVLAVQLFLVSMLRHNAAMRLSGLAVRMVFQLGLHRCPARYSSFTLDDVQLRKRMFWTTYCLDRMLCQSLGLPLSIRDDDIDVCLFEWEKHSGDSLPSITLDSRLASLHFLAKHAEIKGMIVELCNKNIDQRSVDVEARASIEEAMSRWQNDMNSFFDLHPTDLIFHKGRKAALEAIRFECIIALNRPLLALPKETSDYRRALQTCINAARTIIVGLHNKLLAHLAKVASRDAGKALTPLFWPSFTWMVWQSAFIVLFAAVDNEMQMDAAKHLVQKSVEVLEHLSSRNTYWPGISAVAIKELSSQLDAAQHHRAMVKTSPPNMQPTQYSHVEGLLSNGNGYNTATSWPLVTDLTTNDVALFDGFDIPFWLGDDQHSGITDLWNVDTGMQ